MVDAIFAAVPAARLRVLNVGLGEVVSVLLRKRNSGVIFQDVFAQALGNFESEIIRGSGIRKVSVTSRLVTSSFGLILDHSINATDALVLRTALAIARRLRRTGDDLVLVASDQRLLRGARAEGLLAFDPESQDEAALAPLVHA